MPPQAICIRRLEAGDVPAALRIQAAAYPAFLLEEADAFASRIDMAASFCLAAILGENLVGYLLAHGWQGQSPPPVGTILPPDSASEVLFIHDLAIGSAGRGSGLGRTLVDSAARLAADHGLSRAELIAVEGMAPYWRTLGFAEADTSPELTAKISAYGDRARWMTGMMAR